jgi:hypothetical protein
MQWLAALDPRLDLGYMQPVAMFECVVESLAVSPAGWDDQGEACVHGME